MDGGSDWIVLNKDFIRYIVTTNDELVKGLKAVFRHTLLPAEVNIISITSIQHYALLDLRCIVMLALFFSCRVFFTRF